MIYTPQNHELQTATFKIPNTKHNNINKILIITFSSSFNFSNEKCLFTLYIMTTLRVLDKIENQQSTIQLVFCIFVHVYSSIAFIAIEYENMKL